MLLSPGDWCYCFDPYVISVNLKSLILSCGLYLFVPLALAQAPPSESWTFTARFENDLFNSTDRFYTNGIKLNWISPELDWFEELNWMQQPGTFQDIARDMFSLLPYHDDKTRQGNFAISIGQMMYTPNNTAASELIDSERPYAGWLYGSMAFHSKNYRMLDSFEIQAGFTGKWSLAKQAQDLVHSVRGIPRANGWANQIKTEPGVVLVYDRKYRLVPHLKFTDRWGADAIIHAGGTVGNISTYVNGGFEIRAGWDLPADFGSALIRPGGDTNAPVDTNDVRYRDDYRSFSAHLFAATTARFVLRDIFLDGNTFRTSHNVDKKAVVADLVLGISAVYSKFKLSYAHVIRTKEFDGEPGGHDFGSISLSFTY